MAVAGAGSGAGAGDGMPDSSLDALVSSVHVRVLSATQNALPLCIM